MFRALTLRIAMKPFAARRLRIAFVIPSDRPLQVRDVALLHRLVVVNLGEDLELVVFGDRGCGMLGHWGASVVCGGQGSAGGGEQQGARACRRPGYRPPHTAVPATPKQPQVRLPVRFVQTMNNYTRCNVFFKALREIRREKSRRGIRVIRTGDARQASRGLNQESQSQPRLLPISGSTRA